MTRLPRSLQGRLLVLVIGLVAGVWMIAAVATWFDVRSELDELLDGHLAQAAALLMVQQLQESGEGHHEIDAPVLHRYAPGVAFQVFHQGRLMQRSVNAPDAPMVSPAARRQSRFETVMIGGQAWRVFAASAAGPDVQVFVGEQMQARASILHAVVRSTLWPMLIALPLLALSAWWAVRRGVAPLRRLGVALAGRDPHALQPFSVDGAPPEMVPMLAALNGLFERIGRLMEAEHRFTADAAHELRTPIAAIRTQAQVAMGEHDDARRRLALQATIAGCDRAIHLVGQLLTLARLEAGTVPARVRIDLSSLARTVIADEAPQALARRQTIVLEAPESQAIDADPALVAVLLRNLVDNAIRYSPDSARIQVAVFRRERDVVVEVEDDGPGLTAAGMARLGERFFREIGSGESGSGLGWSIVRRVAEVHGARVQAGRSHAMGGLAVAVCWPSAA